MHRPIILLVILLFSFSYLIAQDVSRETIQWNTTGFIDLDANQNFDNSCQFITYGSKQIKWIQDNGKSVVNWNVTGLSGLWTDINKTGTIEYTVADNQTKGTITITKIAQGWTINLVVTGGTSDIRLSYTVTSFEKL